MVKKVLLAIFLAFAGLLFLVNGEVLATDPGYVDCGTSFEGSCVDCDNNGATCDDGCPDCECGSNCSPGGCIPGSCGNFGSCYAVGGDCVKSGWDGCETCWDGCSASEVGCSNQSCPTYCDYGGGSVRDGTLSSGCDCGTKSCPATEPCCTPNWQNVECGGWTCPDEQMYQIDDVCTGNRCVDDVSCSPPSCSMTEWELKPMKDVSYSYAASGLAGGGNLTAIELWETVTGSQVWHELTDPDAPCTISPCTASWTWDSLGYKYVVCNAYDDTISQNKPNSRCTGNPFEVPSTWSDCDVADSDQITVTVVDNKICSVSLGNSSILPGDTVTITYSGNVNGPESDTARVWIEKRDGSEITDLPVVGGNTVAEIFWEDIYYYQTSVSCNTEDYSGCPSTDIQAVFPEAGEYYIHCDVSGDPRKCSGNPFCNYETENPEALITNDCAIDGWVSCSETDSASLIVDCSALTVDITADDSDIDITIVEPASYRMDWSSENADSCTVSIDGGAPQAFTTSGTWDLTNPPGSYSYEYTCINSNDTCSATDSVGVTVDCGVLTADVDVNGEPGDITTFDPYTISWTSTYASSCTLERNSVDLEIESFNGSQTEPADANGDYVYDLSCSNTCGGTQTNSVTVTVNLCGNGVCAGFENCVSCPLDCGECPNAWWQVWGGNLFAALTSGDVIVSDIAENTTCAEPACVPGLSAQDRASMADSDGFPITGGGDIDVNSQMITYREPDVYAIGTAQTRFYENYDYFYSRYSLGLSPDDDFDLTADDAQKPVYDEDKNAYFHSGTLTIQSRWDVASGESYVIFIDGDLVIQDTDTLGELITVAEGGFLSFIVSGDITIADSVGNSVLSNTAGNVEGIFIADGTISIASNGAVDKRFIGEGTFVGWTDLNMLRSFDDGGEQTNNGLYPAETFVYRPDFLKNTPDKMKRAQMLWQETN